MAFVDDDGKPIFQRVEMVGDSLSEHPMQSEINELRDLLMELVPTIAGLVHAVDWLREDTARMRALLVMQTPGWSEPPPERAGEIDPEFLYETDEERAVSDRALAEDEIERARREAAELAAQDLAEGPDGSLAVDADGNPLGVEVWNYPDATLDAPRSFRG